MGTTGLIYAAIAFAWLAYLIPSYLRRKEDTSRPESDPHDRFSDSMRIIRSGSAPLLDQDLAVMPEVEVSTPLTRRAAIRELRRLESDAAVRRRRVLVSLMILLTGAVVVSVMHLTPWWVIAIPGGLVVAFFGISRFTVATMHRQLDRRYQQIKAGSEEATVVLNRRQVADLIRNVTVTTGEEQLPAKKTGGLWDPLPITMPTYVSKPLAPRTVRTIDLSAPELSVQLRTDGPVTADRPVPEPVAMPDQVVEVAKPVAGSEYDRPTEVRRIAGA